jgi:hypothetical protein
MDGAGAVRRSESPTMANVNVRASGCSVADADGWTAAAAPLAGTGSAFSDVREVDARFELLQDVLVVGAIYEVCTHVLMCACVSVRRRRTEAAHLSHMTLLQHRC